MWSDYHPFVANFWGMHEVAVVARCGCGTFEINGGLCCCKLNIRINMSGDRIWLEAADALYICLWCSVEFTSNIRRRISLFGYSYFAKLWARWVAPFRNFWRWCWVFGWALSIKKQQTFEILSAHKPFHSHFNISVWGLLVILISWSMRRNC